MLKKLFSGGGGGGGGEELHHNGCRRPGHSSREAGRLVLHGPLQTLNAPLGDLLVSCAA